MRTLRNLRSHWAILPSILLLALGSSAVVGCGGESLDGTWVQEEGTTPLPDSFGGGDLNVQATVVFDEAASPRTFDINIDLEYMGLTDSLRMLGSYQDGSALTLNIDGFVIDPASMNTSRVAEDGAQCIVLQGFVGTEICFASPQTNAYRLEGDTLRMLLVHTIGGTPESSTTLNMSRSQ